MSRTELGVVPSFDKVQPYIQPLESAVAARFAEILPALMVIVVLSTLTHPDCVELAVVHEIKPELFVIVDPSVCTMPCALAVETGRREADIVPLLISDAAMDLLVRVCVSVVPTNRPLDG